MEPRRRCDLERDRQQLQPWGRGRGRANHLSPSPTPTATARRGRDADLGCDGCRRERQRYSSWTAEHLRHRDRRADADGRHECDLGCRRPRHVSYQWNRDGVAISGATAATTALGTRTLAGRSPSPSPTRRRQQHRRNADLGCDICRRERQRYPVGLPSISGTAIRRADVDG